MKWRLITVSLTSSAVAEAEDMLGVVENFTVTQIHSWLFKFTPLSRASVSSYYSIVNMSHILYLSKTFYVE